MDQALWTDRVVQPPATWAAHLGGRAGQSVKKFTQRHRNPKKILAFVDAAKTTINGKGNEKLEKLSPQGHAALEENPGVSVVTSRVLPVKFRGREAGEKELWPDDSAEYMGIKSV